MYSRNAQIFTPSMLISWWLNNTHLFKPCRMQSSNNLITNRGYSLSGRKERFKVLDV